MNSQLTGNEVGPTQDWVEYAGLLRSDRSVIDGLLGSGAREGQYAPDRHKQQEERQQQETCPYSADAEPLAYRSQQQHGCQCDRDTHVFIRPLSRLRASLKHF
jgi:hypothetical protein